MTVSRHDVEAMVGALFTLIGGIERATRRSPGASALSVLQILAETSPARPSEIAQRQGVHPSLITRHIHELKEQGLINVRRDPADGRASLVTLSKAGQTRLRQLQRIGINRFALFVKDWEPNEIRTFTALINKLEQSKATAAEQEQETSYWLSQPGILGDIAQARREYTDGQTFSEDEVRADLHFPH